MRERGPGVSMPRRLTRRVRRKFGSLQRLVELRYSSDEAAYYLQEARMPFVKVYGSKPARHTGI